MATNTDKQAKIEERIAQLLAKAESTTPEEAEALTEHAERLMIKYMIDQATIDARRAKAGEASEKIVEVKLDFTGAYRPELLNLGWNVIRNLGTLRGMEYTGGTDKVFSLWIVGFESDVEQAKLLLDSLQLQAAVAVREWWKTSKGIYASESAYDQEKHRRSFVYGFGTGVGARLRENRSTAVQAVSKGTELVLVSRQDKVDAHMDAKSLRKGRAKGAFGGGSVAGYEAGKKANTGERGIGYGQRAVES